MNEDLENDLSGITLSKEPVMTAEKAQEKRQKRTLSDDVSAASAEKPPC